MDLANKDISLFNKLAENYKIKVDLGRILNKKFNKGMKIFEKDHLVQALLS